MFVTRIPLSSVAKVHMRLTKRGNTATEQRAKSNAAKVGKSKYSYQLRAILFFLGDSFETVGLFVSANK